MMHTGFEGLHLLFVPSANKPLEPRFGSRTRSAVTRNWLKPDPASNICNPEQFSNTVNTRARRFCRQAAAANSATLHLRN